MLPTINACVGSTGIGGGTAALAALAASAACDSLEPVTIIAAPSSSPRAAYAVLAAVAALAPLPNHLPRVARLVSKPTPRMSAPIYWPRSIHALAKSVIDPEFKVSAADLSAPWSQEAKLVRLVIAGGSNPACACSATGACCAP